MNPNDKTLFSAVYFDSRGRFSHWPPQGNISCPCSVCVAAAGQKEEKKSADAFEKARAAILKDCATRINSIDDEFQRDFEALEAKRDAARAALDKETQEKLAALDLVKKFF